MQHSPFTSRGLRALRLLGGGSLPTSPKLASSGTKGGEPFQAPEVHPASDSGVIEELIEHGCVAPEMSGYLESLKQFVESRGRDDLDEDESIPSAAASFGLPIHRGSYKCRHCGQPKKNHACKVKVADSIARMRALKAPVDWHPPAPELPLELPLELPPAPSDQDYTYNWFSIAINSLDMLRGNLRHAAASSSLRYACILRTPRLQPQLRRS
jgi:hypothetical protein